MLGVTVFTVAAALAIGLHALLILGAPIGFMTMGGHISGVLPARARVVSLVQVVLLVVFIAIVFERAGLASFAPNLSWPIWIVVAVSALSLLAYTITPSKRERLFGMPVGFGFLSGSLFVALGE